MTADSGSRSTARAQPAELGRRGDAQLTPGCPAQRRARDSDTHRQRHAQCRGRDSDTHALPRAAAKVAAEAAEPEARETAFTSFGVREAKEIAASCAVSLPERRHSVSPVSHSPPPPVPKEDPGDSLNCEHSALVEGRQKHHLTPRAERLRFL